MTFEKETMKIKICRTCKGKGVIFDANAGESRICPECRGAGRVVTQTITHQFYMEEFEEFDATATEE